LKNFSTLLKKSSWQFIQRSIAVHVRNWLQQTIAYAIDRFVSHPWLTWPAVYSTAGLRTSEQFSALIQRRRTAYLQKGGRLKGVFIDAQASFRNEISSCSTD